MNEHSVVVIGAGPAGLAAAAELRRRRVSALVVDRADAVGSSWRGRYDRLRLNSSRPFSRLPRGRYPRGTPIFPSRDDMVGYLEGYARRHRVELRLRTEVQRIDEAGSGWLVRTSTGDIHAEQLIVAGGHEHTPHLPDWPGREAFRGRLLHSAAYRNPDSFTDSDVLVVGPGCSGMEIAYDLAEGGAYRVRLAVRTPPNILIRSPAGPLIANVLRRLPTERADAIARVGRQKLIGDLSEFGLPVPEEGVFSRLRRLSVAPAIVDQQVIAAIRERRIEIVAGLESLDANSVLLADGTRIDPDSVIAATGYRTGLGPLAGHLGVLNERGVPRALNGDEAAPGLRFVGYRPLPAHIGHMGREGRRAAKGVARELSRPGAIARRARHRAHGQPLSARL